MSLISRFLSNQYLWLTLIILGAFIIRQYRIDIPLGDWHSWRQADTAAVSRNFIKEGFDILHPKYDDMSPVSEGMLPNPNRYRFVEFPFYNLIVSGVYLALGNVEVVYGRQVSVVFSLASVIFLYLFVKRFLGIRVALFSAFFFAFIPYNIFFSRVFLPEPMMVTASLATLYFFLLFLEAEQRKTPSWGFWFLTVIFFAVTLLTKPYMLYLILPMAYLAWRFLGGKALFSVKLYLLLAASVMPLLAWRAWMLQYPEGIPRISWLFNGGGIRFKGAFFHWIVAERLGREILTVGGFALATIGLLVKPIKNQTWVFHWWLTGAFAYVVIIARGNVEHDYYQIPLVPILAVMMARGVEFLLFESTTHLSRFLTFPVTALLVLAIGAFGWYQVRGFYQINHGEIMQAGDVARQILPADAKVIAPYGGDTAFLYQLDRQGWAITYTSIANLIKLGASHYAAVRFDEEARQVMQDYTIMYQAPNFVIVDLTKPK